jgi:cupin 2 domain-containing protein
MTPVTRGHLPPAAEAPEVGERIEVLAQVGGGAVECILSGRLSSPVGYDQAHDEWVVVLDGAAVLEVAGERLELVTGDWVLLPADVPHRLVATRPGTRWLAIHAPD